VLTLEQACIIIDKALEKGHEVGLKPLTVAVLDAGGHLTALKREDGRACCGRRLPAARLGAPWAWGSVGANLPVVPPAIRFSFRHSAPLLAAASSRCRVVC
jgi:hypothetical protein